MQVRIRHIELAPDNVGAFVHLAHETVDAQGVVHRTGQESRIYVTDRATLRDFTVGDLVQPYVLELVV